MARAVTPWSTSPRSRPRRPSGSSPRTNALQRSQRGMRALHDHEAGGPDRKNRILRGAWINALSHSHLTGSKTSARVCCFLGAPLGQTGDIIPTVDLQRCEAITNWQVIPPRHRRPSVSRRIGPRSSLRPPIQVPKCDSARYTWPRTWPRPLPTRCEGGCSKHS